MLAVKGLERNITTIHRLCPGFEGIDMKLVIIALTTVAMSIQISNKQARHTTLIRFEPSRIPEGPKRAPVLKVTPIS